MKTEVTATFAIKSWEEQTWDGQSASEVTGEKLTLARVAYSYHGDIEGESHLEYLMTYTVDGSGSFVGLERIEGSVKGRSGSFILRHVGTFDAQGVKSAAVVVPGSGSGALKTFQGEGSIDLVGQKTEYPITLDCDFGS